MSADSIAFGSTSFCAAMACGLTSPRLERVEVPTPSMMLRAFLAAFTGLGLVLVLVIFATETTPICPGCERSDELEPSLHPAPKPPGYDELLAQQSGRKVRATLLTVGTVLGGLAFGALVLRSLLVD